LLNQKITIPSNSQLLFTLEEILNQMHTSGNLPYFAKLQDHGTLARVLYPTLMELRLTGITSSQLDPSSFVDEQKGREIQAILQAWESQLTTNNLADPATVYTTALLAPNNHQNTLFIIPANLDFPPLTHQFLQHITQANLIVLPQEAVYNLSQPEALTFQSKEKKEGESPLSWLYQPQDTPNPASLTINRAYGAANEVREVVRYLKQNAIPLDNALITVTNSGRYIPLFYTITLQLNIPATFADGIPAAFTRPGRFVLQLLRWMEEKYASAQLYRLLISGDTNIRQSSLLARLLREAGIGWDRTRYIPCINSLTNTFAKRAEAAKRDDKGTYAEYLSKQQKHVGSLKEILTQLFTAIPEADREGTVDFPALCQGIAEAVCTFSSTASEVEGSAQSTIREALTDAAYAYQHRLKLKEALPRLRQVLDALRIGASPPKPGHIHITSLSQAEWTHRPVTFIVGLDSGSFPGSGLQDPILLDKERRRIHPQLNQKTTEPAKKQYQLAHFLASRRGQLILSYPSFDTVEGRPFSPASILLQAYRLQSNNPEAGYTELLTAIPDPAGFTPMNTSNILTTAEWWMTTALQNTHDHGINTVEQCFYGLASGLQAETYRAQPEFTTHDGRVDADKDRDPRHSTTLTLSATQFEVLANCPYSYFLRYVLRIDPPDETEYDAGVWLDPLTRGSLLHDVYCRYLRETHNHNNPPDKTRLLKIAHELIAEIKQTIPPPSELVFEHEKEELLLGLEVFFRAEQEAICPPAWFEVPFGFGHEEVNAAGLGLPEAVTLPLPDGTQIRLRGRIDRIDYGTQDHLYQVWDYKTGKPYGYEDNQNLKQGRQIQHALYAYAAETILRQSGKDSKAEVEISGYLFPTDRGEAQRFGRPIAKRHLLYDVLTKGLDMVSGGLFCATEDSGRCTFCDYSVVCRQEETTARAREKKEHPDLKVWRELQDYD
jgi:ATP-dependent helicase/nuclease subunit B